MADVRCPVCGKMNPEDAEICQHCLMPLKQEEEEQPDWLSRIREKSKQEQESDSDLPDWLRDEPAPAAASTTGSEESIPSGSGNTPVQPEVPAIAAADDDETPEWLQSLRSQSENEGNPVEDEEPIPPAAEMSDLPNWLKELSAPAAEPSPLAESDEGQVQTTIEPPTVEMPAVPQPPQVEPVVPEASSSWSSWPLAADANFNENPSIPSQDNPPAAEDTSPASMETPQWLSGLALNGSDKSAPFSGQASSEKESVTPDWLAKLNSEFSDNQPPEEQPAALEPGITPDWLTHTQTEENTPESPAAGTPGVFLDDVSQPGIPDQASPFSMEDMPDWLARMSPPDESIFDESLETQPTKEKEKGEEITLAAAELPSWVQAMRPIESATPETPVLVEDDDRVEKVGPLAGLRGILPAEALTSEVRKPPVYPVNLLVSDKQRINAALFESILSSELQPQATPRLRSFPTQRVLRIVIALVLILAVSLPIWSGSQVMPLPGYLPAEVSVIQNTINQLAPGSTVLIAVDYEPALAGEVEAVASSVVAHIMSKSANIILISTNPMGSVLSEQLLNRAQVSQPGYDITTKTLDLGYLAGGPSGLFNFAIQPQLTTPLTVDRKNAWEQPLLKDKSLSDFAGVFVLTESADTARTWVEQVKPALGNVPLFMITSAQVAPMIRPYYDASQIQGFVSGLTGGAIYEQSSAASNLSSNYWDAYQSGILIAIALLAIGGLISIGDIVFARRKFREGEQA
jgi:hypothetical protein